MSKLKRALILATPIIFFFLPLLWVSWKVVLAIFVMMTGLRFEDALIKWEEKNKVKDMLNYLKK